MLNCWLQTNGAKNVPQILPVNRCKFSVIGNLHQRSPSSKKPISSSFLPTIWAMAILSRSILNQKLKPQVSIDWQVKACLFVDAHSGSGVCTPTRYGLVCGRYAWRTRLKRGVLGGYSKPLIDAEQQTFAGQLQAAGYHTHAIGKWHLGLGWQWKDKSPDNINNFGIAGKQGDVDYAKPITDGPLEHGFTSCHLFPRIARYEPRMSSSKIAMSRPFLTS